MKGKFRPPGRPGRSRRQEQGRTIGDRSAISRGRSLQGSARYHVGILPRVPGCLVEDDVALADRGVPWTEGRDGRAAQEPDKSAWNALARGVEQIAIRPAVIGGDLSPFAEEQAAIHDGLLPFRIGNVPRLPDLQT